MITYFFLYDHHFCDVEDLWSFVPIQVPKHGIFVWVMLHNIVLFIRLLIYDWLIMIHIYNVILLSFILYKDASVYTFPMLITSVNSTQK